MSRPYYLHAPRTFDVVIRKAQRISYDFMADLQRQTHRDYYPQLSRAEARAPIRRATKILNARIQLKPIPTTISELDDTPYIQGLWPYTITEFLTTPDLNKKPLL